MEFLMKVFDAFWSILSFLEPSSADEKFAFYGIIELLNKIFKK